MRNYLWGATTDRDRRYTNGNYGFFIDGNNPKCPYFVAQLNPFKELKQFWDEQKGRQYVDDLANGKV